MNDPIEVKTETLVREALKKMPHLTQTDAMKRTPDGLKFRQMAADVARKIFAQTEDRDFLQIAHTFERDIGRKPAPGFDAK